MVVCLSAYIYIYILTHYTHIYERQQPAKPYTRHDVCVCDDDVYTQHTTNNPFLYLTFVCPVDAPANHLDKCAPGATDFARANNQLPIKLKKNKKIYIFIFMNIVNHICIYIFFFSSIILSYGYYENDRMSRCDYYVGFKDDDDDDE